jgi:hypothetical protein
MTGLIFAALLLYVIIDGTAQGKFAWLTREWVPPAAQAKVSVVLHWLCPALFVILATVIAVLRQDWRCALLAGLLRLALFDPVFTLSRGDKLFSLGSSAWLDKLLARIPHASNVVRVLALVAALVVMWWIWLPAAG